MAETGQDTGIAADFLLEIVIPERQLVSERVDAVRAPGIAGEFGVLPSHDGLPRKLHVQPQTAAQEPVGQ